MKKVFLCAGLLLSCLLSVGQTTVSVAERNAQDYKLGKALEVFTNLISSVNVMYVDSTDPEGMMRTAAEAMLAELDPYTEYLPESAMDDFAFTTTGKYGGIGALIRQKGEWVEIAEPYKDTPSDKAGIRAGDRIVAINGVSMRGMGSQKVSATLKGNAGEKIAITIRPIADTTTTNVVELVRQKIAIPAVPYYGIVSKGAQKIGYLRLTSFTDECSSEVRHALESLRAEHISGLIFDLRGNGGGIVGQAIKIAAMFVPKDTEIVSLRGRSAQSNTIYKTEQQPVDNTLPLVMLVSSVSASASEILCGAFQDLDRAVVMGQRTFGKGLVQGTRPLGYNSFLKVTTAKYYTPSGRSIQALDYTHKREDGSVGQVPDSLITEFYTTAGRKVYNGGGVNPDVKLDGTYYAKFTAILLAYGFIDDFANQYVVKNHGDLSTFVVDSALYESFKLFMADKTIEYKSATEVTLEKLKEYAEREKYDDRIADELKAIAAKIKDDKLSELNMYSEQIKQALAEAIVGRWFYERGRIEYSLREDKEVARAVELLENKNEYQRILKEQDTDKN